MEYFSRQHRGGAPDCYSSPMESFSPGSGRQTNKGGKHLFTSPLPGADPGFKKGGVWEIMLAYLGQFKGLHKEFAQTACAPSPGFPCPLYVLFAITLYKVTL